MTIYILNVFKHLKLYSKFLSILNYILREVEEDSKREKKKLFHCTFTSFQEVLPRVIVTTWVDSSSFKI